MPPHPTVAYKVLAAPEFDAFRQGGTYAGSAADRADGFIHLSTADQLDATLDRHYAGRADLVIAAIDLGPVAAILRWEPSRGGALFPHLYGPLPYAAVIAAMPIERGTDGAAKRPA